jgi:hypothetical protein
MGSGSLDERGLVRDKSEMSWWGGHKRMTTHAISDSTREETGLPKDASMASRRMQMPATAKQGARPGRNRGDDLDGEPHAYPAMPTQPNALTSQKSVRCRSER